MPILNSETYLSYYTSSLEPERDENGNIISITSSDHPINEVSQFVERSSIYTYYTSSYLGRIFDFDFKELGVSSDERTMQPADIPLGAILISQSEYDYLITTNSSLQVEVEQLKTITGSLYETINYLETTIESLLEIIGGGTQSLNPTITTTHLPAGYINETYNAVLNVVGGVVPYIWTIDGNALPDGLSLNSITGVVSGTPTQLFNNNIIFGVTDFLQRYNSKTVGLIIKERPPPPGSGSLLITTPERLPNGYRDEYYEKQLVVGGGSPPYLWSLLAGNYLPYGLTLSQNGLISGIPLEQTIPTWSYEIFNIKVVDTQNNEKTKEFKMKIRRRTRGTGIPKSRT